MSRIHKGAIRNILKKIHSNIFFQERASGATFTKLHIKHAIQNSAKTLNYQKNIGQIWYSTWYVRIRKMIYPIQLKAR